MIRFLQTPGKAKKIVLGALLLMICGAMVITMIPGGILGDAMGYSVSPNAVAEVGDLQVTVAEVDLLAREMGRQQFPRGGLPAQFMPFLRQRAAEALIMQRAMIVEAQRMGFRVSDEELRDALRQNPSLFPGGQFVGQQAYEAYVLQNTNLSVPEFERRIRDDLLVMKLRRAVEAGLTVSDDEIAEQYRRENTKVKFRYAVLSLDELKKTIHPEEKELRQFFDKNKQRYENSIPEKRRAEYVLVETAKLRDQVQVTPDELRRAYNERQDQYRLPEQVNVRHILIKTPAPDAQGKVDEKAVESARKKAESLLDQLKKGADFADLAKKNSEDPGSASQGGLLGFVQRGRTVAEFEQVAFSLPSGQLSGLVRTTYGFHIIRVEEKQPARLKSLDEVKAELEPALISQKASARAEELARNLQNQARTGSLQQAAQKNGLPMLSTDLFSRTDSLPGLGTSPEFMSAIFSADSTARAEMVQIPLGYAVFNVLEVKPPSTPTFEEIKATVEQDLKSERALMMLAQKTQELSDHARSEHDLQKAAKALGAQLRTSELVGPNDEVPDIGSMAGAAQEAFSMKPGDISGPISTGNGGVVIALTEKQEPPTEQLALSKERIREELLQRKRTEFFATFADHLRKRMEDEKQIRINQQVMNQLMRSTQAG